VSLPKRVYGGEPRKPRVWRTVYRFKGDMGRCVVCGRITHLLKGKCGACSEVKREPSFGAYGPAKMPAQSRRRGSRL